MTARERIEARRYNRQPPPKGPIGSFFNLIFRIIRGAFLTFSNAKGTEAAASLAYYTVFSIFPLLIVIVSIGSYIMDPALIELKVAQLLPNLFPVAQDYIMDNLEALIKVRGSVSLISIAGLIWSASAVFSTLVRNVNSAWPAAARHSYISTHLTSLGIVAILAILLIVSSFSVTLKNLILSLGVTVNFDMIGAFFSSPFYTVIVPFLTRFILFFALYYLVPQIHVKKKSALIGSIFIATIWQFVSFGLNAYLSTKLTQYQVIYGSMAKIIVLFAWIYFTGYLILFGAHFTSSIDRHTG